MRTWVKATLGGVGLLLLVMLTLGAIGGYYVARSLERQAATEADAVREMDAVRTNYAGRTPLLEVVDARRGDIRINRVQTTPSGRVTTVHVINWKAEDGQIVRVEFPLWLMRFSSVNLLSQLGVAPARFRLTVDDVERYGPGIVVDHGAPGEFRLLMWVD